MSVTGLSRRAVAGLVIAGAALFLGRSLVVFLTERWWRSGLGSGISAFGTWWVLVGTGLELLALLFSFAWLAIHFLAAVRAALTGDPAGEIGRSHLAGLPEDLTRWGTVGVAAVLAALLSGGVATWTPDLVLAWHDARFGLTDPAFGQDLGHYLARLPLRIHLHRFATLLLWITGAGVTAAYGFGGALVLRRGRLLIAPSARRHLGLLGALLAVCLTWGYLMRPDLVAAGASVPVPPAQVRLHEILSLILAGASGAVAALTLAWGFRAARTTALAAWSVLLVGMGVVRFLVPPDPGSGGRSADPRWVETRQRLALVGFGLDPGKAAVVERGMEETFLDPADAVGLWDREDLAQALPPGYRVAWVGRDGGTRRPTWWVLAAPPGAARPGDSVQAFRVSDQRVARGGKPFYLHPSDATAEGLFRSRLTLLPGMVYPRETGTVVVLPAQGEGGRERSAARAGMHAGSFVRRLALAWALQTTRVLDAAPRDLIAWHLSPTDRLRSVAPFADWIEPRFVILNGVPFWVLDGVLTSAMMPATTRLPWRGTPVGFARVEFIGLIRAETGEVRIFLRPEASAFAKAWAEIAEPMIEPSDLVPAGLDTTYPEMWNRMRAGLFGTLEPAGGPPPPAGLLPVRVTPPGEAAGEGGGEGIGQFLLLPGEPGTLARVIPADSVEAQFRALPLRARWARLPFYRQLRDSITATGSDLREGAIRYLFRGDGVLAYQPLYAGGPAGTQLVALAMAQGPRVGIGRGWETALASLQGTRPLEAVGGPEATIDQARVWLAIADSALRRGDLTTFGRAFQALRDLLGR